LTLSNCTSTDKSCILNLKIAFSISEFKVAVGLFLIYWWALSRLEVILLAGAKVPDKAFIVNLHGRVSPNYLTEATHVHLPIQIRNLVLITLSII